MLVFRQKTNIFTCRKMPSLRSAGCEEIYSDIASGVKTARPGLHTALSHLRKGDTLVVWKLDRLGRSLTHLIQTVKELSEKESG
jgi:DNA invertase Pin-like site-specific DNA recombinase